MKIRLPPEKLWAIGLGVAVACLSWLLAPAAIDGRIWQPLTEAALLRPPEQLQPGVWRLMTYACVRTFGLGTTLSLLSLAGPLALGYVSYRAASGITTALALMLRTDRCPVAVHRFLMPGLVTAAVGYFATTWPLFQSSWMLSPQLLFLVFLFTIFGLMRRFLIGSRLSCGLAAGFLCGVISAESLLGWIVLIVSLISCHIRIWRDPERRFVLSNPATRNLMKWELTVVFCLGFGAVLAANGWFFVHHGGAWNTAFVNYFGKIRSGDLAVVFGLVVAPFLMTSMMLPQATDTQDFLSYARGLSLVVCGITSAAFLFQPGIVSFESEAVTVLLRYFATFSFTGSLTAVIVEVYCRNHLSLFVLRFGADDPEQSERKAFRYPLFIRRWLGPAFSGLLVVMAILSLCRDGTRTLTRELDRCAREILLESEGLDRLFTDGSLDELLEIKSACDGERLMCVSLFSKRSEHDVAVRQRGLTGADDLQAMTLGGAIALGQWIDANDPQLARSGAQVGLELWRRSKTRPVLGGFIARPGGYDVGSGADGEGLAQARRQAEAFAERADTPEVRRAYERCHDRRLKQRFDKLMWRVARILELRAHEEDRNGRIEEGSRLLALAHRLDGRNGSITEMRSSLGLMWEQTDLRFTPREVLLVMLNRADFRAARPHAEAVLESNENDPDANFALGMFYYREKNLKRADLHLQRALDARPRQPAILNNLANVRMKLGRLEEALELSDLALQLKPDVPEVRQTNEEIRHRLETLTPDGKLFDKTF